MGCISFLVHAFKSDVPFIPSIALVLVVQHPLVTIVNQEQIRGATNNLARERNSPLPNSF